MGPDFMCWIDMPVSAECPDGILEICNEEAMEYYIGQVLSAGAEPFTPRPEPERGPEALEVWEWNHEQETVGAAALCLEYMIPIPKFLAPYYAPAVERLA